NLTLRYALFNELISKYANVPMVVINKELRRLFLLCVSKKLQSTIAEAQARQMLHFCSFFNQNLTLLLAVGY
ncbi:hypothetical protein, partial [Dysgonomonas hofstadii]|uniref:hypothetical protein n=1 Tax=Dysgonomonas hofstadii TaxID=637886 RepID=UPI001C851243